MQVGAGAGPGAAAGGNLLALHDLLPDLHLHAARRTGCNVQLHGKYQSFRFNVTNS